VTDRLFVVGEGFGCLPAARFLDHVDGGELSLVGRRNDFAGAGLANRAWAGTL
jgi:hypothetical protein